MRVTWLISALAFLPLARAQDPEEEARRQFERTLSWKTGEVQLGAGLATLQVGEGLRFLGPSDAQRVLATCFQGRVRTMGDPLGMLFTARTRPTSRSAWGVVITLEEGFVSDGDAEDMDFDELMQGMKRHAEEEAQRAGVGSSLGVRVVGWAGTPRYDRQRRTLHWGRMFRVGREEVLLNYDMRLLGRNGVLLLQAVGTMVQMDAIQREVPGILAAVELNPGHRYEEAGIAERLGAIDVETLIETGTAAGEHATLLGKLFRFGGKWLVLLAALLMAAGWRLVTRRRASR